MLDTGPPLTGQVPTVDGHPPDRPPGMGIWLACWSSLDESSFEVSDLTAQTGRVRTGAFGRRCICSLPPVGERLPWRSRGQAGLQDLPRGVLLYLPRSRHRHAQCVLLACPRVAVATFKQSGCPSSPEHVVDVADLLIRAESHAPRCRQSASRATSRRWLPHGFFWWWSRRRTCPPPCCRMY